MKGYLKYVKYKFHMHRRIDRLREAINDLREVSIERGAHPAFREALRKAEQALDKAQAAL